jgi:hypothetical protein
VGIPRQRETFETLGAGTRLATGLRFSRMRFDGRAAEAKRA